MRWVFCHVTIQQISSGEETWKETRKGDPLPSVTPIASYTLSTFRSEERRKKKKIEMRGWKKENCSLQPRSLCAPGTNWGNTFRAAPTLLNKPAVSSLCWSALFNIYLCCLARRPTLKGAWENPHPQLFVYGWSNRTFSWLLNENFNKIFNLNWLNLIYLFNPFKFHSSSFQGWSTMTIS